MNRKGFLAAGLIIGLASGSCATAFATDGIKEIKAYINDSFQFQVNGEDAVLDDEYHVLVYNDRSYLPVRGIGDMMGADISWNEETKMISIVTKANDTDPTDSTEDKYVSYSALPQHAVNTEYIVDVTKYLQRSEGGRVYINIENRSENIIALKPAATIIEADGVKYNYNRDISIADRDDTWYSKTAKENESLQGYILLPKECSNSEYLHLELSIIVQSSSGIGEYVESFDIKLK